MVNPVKQIYDIKQRERNMKKYEGYLMASDLDGTLINSELGISNQNIEAIASFIREGGLFAIATGRTELTSMPFMERINVNCPCILYNGAAIYDTKAKTYIKAHFLDKRLLLGVLKEILCNYPRVCMQIFVHGNIYIVSGTENMDQLMLKEKQVFEFACIDDIADRDWFKVLLNDKNQTLHEIQQLINTKLPPGVIHSAFSTATYLELFAWGVTKGSALEDLLKITGIERERTIAIGDYCNDIEMVKAAGLGVATSNAHPLLKEAADIITVSNDENAVSTLINRLLPAYAAAMEDREDKHSTKEKEAI